MLKPKFILSERKLDLPIYSLSEKKDRTKSTFVDSNRVDTVRPCSRFYHLKDFIQDECFYKMIFETCYEAIISDNKRILLSYPRESACGDEIEEFLENFFERQNLGVIFNCDYNKYKQGIIEIKLNENVTFKDIGNAYISVLERFSLPEEDIKVKKMVLKKKINNEEN